MSQTIPRFEFGRNWKQYIEQHFGQERVDTSRLQMLKFLNRENLHGLRFLDIGCGSGLHSLGALQAGATSITSFDFDPNSVAATQILVEHAGHPPHWSVMQGSVLDKAFMDQLPVADVVYSWGVLHHTGDVWSAIRNAAGKVLPGGLFFIALYSADVQKDPTPEFWLNIKKRYVSSSPLRRRMYDWWYVWRFMMQRNVRRIPEVIKRFRTHKKTRGMDLMTDVRDWLGGWPMEFVYDADATAFCEGLGFKLEKISTGEANTEFLFRRITPDLQSA